MKRTRSTDEHDRRKRVITVNNLKRNMSEPIDDIAGKMAKVNMGECQCEEPVTITDLTCWQLIRAESISAYSEVVNRNGTPNAVLLRVYLEKHIRMLTGLHVSLTDNVTKNCKLMLDMLQRYQTHF